MYELNRHKKSDRIKWIFTGIAFVLVFVFLATLCMQLFGNDKIKPANWFKKTEQMDKLPDSEDDKNGGAIITDNETSTDDVHIKSRKLARSEYEENGISAQSDDAFRLVATVYPEEATYKLVDWSIAWSNASSTWASGKNVNDYYSITPTSDGSLTANAVCKQAFAEPVIITCKLRNDTISATVRADYVSKLDMEFGFGCYWLECDGESWGYYKTNWSIGTITDGAVKIINIDIVFLEELQAVIRYICNLPEFQPYYNDYYDDVYVGGYLPTYEEWDEDGQGDFITNDWGQMFSLQEGLSSAQIEKAKNIIYKGFYDKCGRNLMKDWVRYDVSYTYTIDGQTYNGYGSVNGDFNAYFAGVSATSLSVSEINVKH